MSIWWRCICSCIVRLRRTASMCWSKPTKAHATESTCYIVPNKPSAGKNVTIFTQCQPGPIYYEASFNAIMLPPGPGTGDSHLCEMPTIYRQSSFQTQTPSVFHRSASIVLLCVAFFFGHLPDLSYVFDDFECVCVMAGDEGETFDTNARKRCYYLQARNGIDSAS